MKRAPLTVVVCLALLAASPGSAEPAHPRLLFDGRGLEMIRASASTSELAPVRARLIERADRLASAPPLIVSPARRGEPDPPGQLKGLESARRLQGRVFTLAMAFLLTGEPRYRDAAVAQLDHALTTWWTWVDTAHQPPFDLMTGETCLTYAVAYDWLYDALTPAERTRLREGVERRALRGYLEATTGKPMFWFTARMNWNPVTNGGAAMLALALGSDSELSRRVLDLAAPAMAHYWNELQDDGAWAEGTGYWTYGHRYAFMAADALRRAGRVEGARYLERPGARTTGYFPIVFNPGRTLSASFGDSSGRARDPIFYFLAREYKNPDFAWFEDRATPRGPAAEGWPEEALVLAWKAGQPASRPGPPDIPAVKAFGSIGWAMIAPSQPDPPFFVAFKNGSLAANHTHLDLNQVSVGVGETMVLTDLGSRPYPADYFDADRRPTYYEVSTAGHNTVLVDGKGQVTGRSGTLVGPMEGPRYAAFTGIADGTYQATTPLARRHVIFVDARYYVLLDEVRTGAPVPVELRFHSYGGMTAGQSGQWTVTLDGASVIVAPALDARTGTPILEGTQEAATGWIRPVNVLRLRSTAGDHLLAATVLLPVVGGRPPAAPKVLQSQDGDKLFVDVGADRLTWVRRADGYEFTGVVSLTRPEAGRRPVPEA
jgi:hypothetical protein